MENLQKLLKRRIISFDENQSNIPSKLIDSRFQWIFIGSLANAQDLLILQDLRISNVLTVAGIHVYDEPKPEINHFLVNIADHPSSSIFEILTPCFQFIDHCRELNENILIHCASGVSRSVTVCIAYLMIRFLLSLDESLFIVQESRPLANPNVGFRYQLQILESCKHDLVRAHELFVSSNLSTNIMGNIMQQREQANDIHREIDDIETKYKSKELILRTSPTIINGTNELDTLSDFEQILRRNLLEIQSRLVPTPSLPQELVTDVSSPLSPPQPLPHLPIVDRVTLTILKSALSKAQRLLQEIHSMYSSLLPANSSTPSSPSVYDP